MREGPFGLPWFWKAVVGILAATCGALLVLVFIQQHNYAASAAAEARDYTPAPLPTFSTTGRPTAAFIGDSYAAGAGSTDSASRSWPALVAAREGWSLSNLAYGGTGYITNASDGQRACGSATCPAYSDVISKAAALNPSIVFVSGGRNDVGKSDSAVQRGARAFFNQLRKALPKAKIYVSSPMWQDTAPPAQLATIARDVKSAAVDVDATYLDIGEPLKGNASDISSDGVHPNDAGHRAIAAAVEKALE